MQSRLIVMPLMLTTLLITSTLAGAAEKKPSKEPAATMPGMEKMNMDHGMMQDGMMGGRMMQGGMMDMMKRCRQMMSDPMMPALPAGNEKLQLQMHAEMMQKMGEILGRYAEQIKDEKRSAP